MDTDSPEVRRRRRPAVSCTLCRRRKIRCNRETPCSNCRRSKSAVCIYENNHQVEGSQITAQQSAASASKSLDHVSSATNSYARRSFAHCGIALKGHDNLDDTTLVTDASARPYYTSSVQIDSSTSPSTAASVSTNSEDTERLKLRIRQLEEQLSNSTLEPAPTHTSTPASEIVTTRSRFGGVMHAHTQLPAAGHSHAIVRSITHKTRTFGQSHWGVNGVALIRDIFDVFECHPAQQASTMLAAVERCKALARIIKSRRLPPWPCPPTADLPTKDVADALIDCYLQTSESVYRILHIPSFRREYEALWAGDKTVEVSPFLVQLKLVLAIGAITYDRCFSLRTLAVRWIYEAQVWVSEPKFKSRLDLQNLQTNALLLIAQEGNGVTGDSMWIAVGGLLRRAVYMGLHRDPVHLPPRSIFAAEMRRRLWNTITELALQSSLDSGGQPYLSLKDFDTAPPANLDDEELLTDNPLPKPDTEYTQTSIALALRQTFPQRLAVVKFLNDLSSTGTYEETLRLGSDLRSAYKALSRTLQSCSSSSGPSPSQFQINVVDLIMHRYIMCLHVPYYGPSLSETAYAFSRKVAIDSALRMWRAAHPIPSYPAGPTTECDLLRRLSTCSSGFYPTVSIHAALFIAIELRTQLQEDESIGPAALRPDLLMVLHEAKDWSMQVVESGETNVKGTMLIAAVATQVEGLRLGLDKEQAVELLIKDADDVAKKCLGILEDMAAAQGGIGDSGVQDRDVLTLSTEGIEDWAFMSSDSGGAFDSSGSYDPMSWMFNVDTDIGMPSLW